MSLWAGSVTGLGPSPGSLSHRERAGTSCADDRRPREPQPEEWPLALRGRRDERGGVADRAGSSSRAVLFRLGLGHGYPGALSRLDAFPLRCDTGSMVPESSLLASVPDLQRPVRPDRRLSRAAAAMAVLGPPPEPGVVR